MIDVLEIFCKFFVQLVILVPVAITILSLKMFGMSEAADEVEDWWLHL